VLTADPVADITLGLDQVLGVSDGETAWHGTMVRARVRCSGAGGAATGVPGGALDALEADHDLADVLGGYFAGSFIAYKRNEIERFERYVTDWEYREYVYHL
jgi:hypothetical protein